MMMSNYESKPRGPIFPAFPTGFGTLMEGFSAAIEHNQRSLPGLFPFPAVDYDVSGLVRGPPGQGNAQGMVSLLKPIIEPSMFYKDVFRDVQTTIKQRRLEHFLGMDDQEVLADCGVQTAICLFFLSSISLLPVLVVLVPILCGGPFKRKAPNMCKCPD